MRIDELLRLRAADFEANFYNLRQAEWPLMLQSYIGYVGAVWLVDALHVSEGPVTLRGALVLTGVFLTTLAHFLICVYTGLRIQERMHALRDAQNRAYDLLHLLSGCGVLQLPFNDRSTRPIHGKWYAFVPFLLSHVLLSLWTIAFVVFRVESVPLAVSTIKAAGILLVLLSVLLVWFVALWDFLREAFRANGGEWNTTLSEALADCLVAMVGSSDCPAVEPISRQAEHDLSLIERKFRSFACSCRPPLDLARFEEANRNARLAVVSLASTPAHSIGSLAVNQQAVRSAFVELRLRGEKLRQVSGLLPRRPPEALSKAVR